MAYLFGVFLGQQPVVFIDDFNPIWTVGVGQEPTISMVRCRSISSERFVGPLYEVGPLCPEVVPLGPQARDRLDLVLGSLQIGPESHNICSSLAIFASEPMGPPCTEAGA
jgi:hypothetical protein